MKKIHITVVLFLIILLVAAGIRLWNIGNVPAGLDWDEASLGYNAFSILHTGRDEYGKWLPVVLKSFGDYKPALYAYLIIPFIYFMGLTAQAVRLPSAILGIATVACTFFLAKKMFSSNKMGILTMTLLAFSPWHIQFSRIGFEANVGLFFNVTMATLFLYGIKKPWLLLFSAVSFCLALYTYQSEKVFTPLLAIALIIIWWKEIWKLPKKILFVTILLACVLLAPMVQYMVTDRNFFARAEGVSIFAQADGFAVQSSQEILVDRQFGDKIGTILDNRRILMVKTILAHYLVHFDPNWLFINGNIARHRAPYMGLLYLWELPFILIGLYQLLFSRIEKKYTYLIFSWFLLAPVPAMVTTGVPHEVRILNILPTYQLFTGFGLLSVFSWVKNWKKIIQIAFFCIFAGFVSLNVLYYFDQYFVQTNYYAARDWRYGYKQIVEKVSSLQKGYASIVVSNKDMMDQSYIFFLFYLQYPPQLYQQDVAKGLEQGDTHMFGKYEFRFVDPSVINCDAHTLVVGHYDQFRQPLPAQFIAYYPDHTPGIEILGKNFSLCKKPISH